VTCAFSLALSAATSRALNVEASAEFRGAPNRAILMRLL